MKEHRIDIIDAIWNHVFTQTKEQWPGERTWDGIRRIVKGLVKRLKEHPEFSSAESNNIMVKSDGLGSYTVYINVGEW